MRMYIFVCVFLSRTPSSTYQWRRRITPWLFAKCAINKIIIYILFYMFVANIHARLWYVLSPRILSLFCSCSFFRLHNNPNRSVYVFVCEWISCMANIHIYVVHSLMGAILSITWSGIIWLFIIRWVRERVGGNVRCVSERLKCVCIICVREYVLAYSLCMRLRFVRLMLMIKPYSAKYSK